MDFNENGELSDPPTEPPTVIAEDGSFVLVGLNTTNYCGVEMAVPPDVQRAVETLTSRADSDPHLKALLDDWRIRGRFDIARLGSHQQRHAADALRAAAPDDAVRIAVMHHQLLPISPDEEVKPFEALTNLGEIRDFLAANNINLLLHGHKHLDHIYEDRYRPNMDGHNEGIRKLLVCSAGTVGLGQPHSGEIAKLLTIDAGHAAARRVTIESVPATRHGIPLVPNAFRRQSYQVSNSYPEESGHIIGKSAQDVHEQLLDLFARSDKAPPQPLICRFSDGGSGSKRPGSYPGLIGGGWRTDDEWFELMVALWQRETPIRGMSFNHGSRIYRYGGDRDQLQAAAKSLRRDPGTGRAVVVLLDPMRDHPEGQDVRYPSFCMVQFMIRGKRLDLIAYFRKQEMRYWWAVNAAELSLLQQRVLEALADLDARYLPGDVVTVTAIPVASDHVPGVAVTWIDQVADEQPSELARLAVSVCARDLPNRESFFDDWMNAVKDWQPDEETRFQGSPIPTVGMLALAEAVEEMARTYQTQDRVEELVNCLKHIHQLNIEFANKSHSLAGYHYTYEGWQAKVRGPIKSLLQNARTLLTDSSQ